MNIENPSINSNTEQETQRYTYRDNRKQDENGYGEKIFECEAKSIIEADELYKEATKQDVEKQSYIGCSIDKI